MANEEKGRIPESPAGPDNNGRTGASPSLEHLTGENKRQAEKLSALETEISEKDSRITELQNTHDKTQADIAELRKLIESRNDAQSASSDLVKRLERQAAEGDETAQAYLAAMDARIAKALAEREEKIEKKMEVRLTKEQISKEFEARDEFLDNKSKELKVTTKELLKLLDEHADNRLDGHPMAQAKDAFSRYMKVRSLDERDAALKAKETEREQIEGGGTGGTGGSEKKGMALVDM